MRLDHLLSKESTVLVGLAMAQWLWVWFSLSLMMLCLLLWGWVWRWVEHKRLVHERKNGFGALLGPEGTPCLGCCLWPLAWIA